MATVTVNINGRNYRMACDDGQEEHLTRLAKDLDGRIAQLRRDFGEIGDMRLTVMAALILADELAEARQRMRRVEEELLGMQQDRAAAAGHAEDTQADVAAGILEAGNLRVDIDLVVCRTDLTASFAAPLVASW